MKLKKAEARAQGGCRASEKYTYIYTPLHDNMIYNASFIAGRPNSSGAHENTDYKTKFRLPETGKTRILRPSEFQTKIFSSLLHMCHVTGTPHSP
jgi:hypothetical protein